MADHPTPCWVTTEEGGDYIPWPEWQAEFKNKLTVHSTYTHAQYQNRWRIHAVGFDDGTVFDNMAGWRTWSTERVPHSLLVRMGLLPENPLIRWREPVDRPEPEPVDRPEPKGFWAHLFGW
jgi:hypothetical protein